jgi:hydroxymethylpyrimidine pyrophosphatase-like HAD family hydrolase
VIAGSRTAFLDYDGTFAAGTYVPAEHLEATRAARSNGHRIFLCTGRPRCMFTDSFVAEFDGIVGLAGGYVEVAGDVVTDTVFSRELMRATLQVLDEYDVVYTLEARDALHVTRRNARRLQQMADAHRGPHSPYPDVLSALRVGADGSFPSFGKVTCWASTVPVSELAARIGPEVASIAPSLPGLGRFAGEIYLAVVSKAVGMQEVATRLRIGPTEIVAVGDGLNDLELLAGAGTAVAVAGAPPEILALADYVTAGPLDLGIVQAFRWVGLID